MTTLQTITSAPIQHPVEQGTKTQHNNAAIFFTQVSRVQNANATGFSALNRHGNLFAGMPRTVRQMPDTLTAEPKRSTALAQHKMNRQGNLFGGMPRIVNQDAQTQQPVRVEGPKPRALHNLNRHGNLFMGIPSSAKSTHPGTILNQYRTAPHAPGAQDSVAPAPVRQHAMNRHGNLFAGIPASASVYEAPVYRPGIAAQTGNQSGATYDQEQRLANNSSPMSEQEYEAIDDDYTFDTDVLDSNKLIFDDHIDSGNESLDNSAGQRTSSQSEDASSKSYPMHYAAYHLTAMDSISWDDTFANGLEPDDSLWDELHMESPPPQEPDPSLLHKKSLTVLKEPINIIGLQHARHTLTTAITAASG